MARMELADEPRHPWLAPTVLVFCASAFTPRPPAGCSRTMVATLLEYAGIAKNLAAGHGYSSRWPTRHFVATDIRLPRLPRRAGLGLPDKRIALVCNIA